MRSPALHQLKNPRCCLSHRVPRPSGPPLSSDLVLASRRKFSCTEVDAHALGVMAAVLEQPGAASGSFANSMEVECGQLRPDDRFPRAKGLIKRQDLIPTTGGHGSST